MAKIAFLFAGQGAQTVGMGKDLYETFPAAKSVFDAGEKILNGVTDICFNAEKEVLNKTENTQPCLFLTDLAIADTLLAAGVVPDAVAGFSLGEIPALSFAGVMSFEDAFKFVVVRGKTMAEASKKHPGAMVAALKLDAKTVEKTAAEFSEMWPVNYNCPGQIVCAGKSEQADEFAEAIKLAGGRAVKLPVSGAFHTPYMESVKPVLEKTLNNLSVNAPKTTVYANRTALPYPNVKSEIISTLSSQVCNPVKWEQTIKNLQNSGIDTFIEVGAGQTLTSLVKRTLTDVNVFTVNDATSVNAVLQELKGE